MFLRRGRPAGVWTAQVFCCLWRVLSRNLHISAASGEGAEGRGQSRNKTDLCAGRLTVPGAPEIETLFREWHLDRVQKVRSSNLGAWTVRRRGNI
jgi:hypothetical protein